VIAGTSGRALVKVENDGTATFRAPAALSFFLSADTTLDDGDVLVGTINRPLKVAPGHLKSVLASLTYPGIGPAGDYYLLAEVEPATVGTPPAPNPSNAVASGSLLTIQPAQVDLHGNDSGIGGALSHIPQTVSAGGAMSIVLHIGNSGNAGAEGELTYTFTIRRNDTTESDPGITLITVTRHVRLGTNGHTKLSTRVVLPPSVTPGRYELSAGIDTTNAFSETNEANNSVKAKLPLSVV
jgi:hypothetical protein